MARAVAVSGATGHDGLAYPLRDALGIRPVAMPLVVPRPAVQRQQDQPEAIGRVLGDDKAAPGPSDSHPVLADGFNWQSPNLQPELEKLAERLWQNLRRRLKVERERSRGWV